MNGVAGGRTGLVVDSRRGANVQASVDGDGTLTVTTLDRRGRVTAEEVAGLDLWGTQLVVLSACDTGLGEMSQPSRVVEMQVRDCGESKVVR